MGESINPLVAFSDHAAQLVERTGSSIVAVHGNHLAQVWQVGDGVSPTLDANANIRV